MYGRMQVLLSCKNVLSQDVTSYAMRAPALTADQSHMEIS